MGFISLDFDGLSKTISELLGGGEAKVDTLGFANDLVTSGSESGGYHPAGVGFADMIYLPKKDSPMPALVVELKWDPSAEGAIAQIKDRKYMRALEGYGRKSLLVGINYQKDAPPGQRRHSCVIEVWWQEELIKRPDSLTGGNNASET